MQNHTQVDKSNDKQFENPLKALLDKNRVKLQYMTNILIIFLFALKN